MSKKVNFSDPKLARLISRQLLTRLSEKNKKILAFHMLAVTFLSYHFDTSKFDDSVVTNLRNLLKDQFNAGRASVRKAKKRTRRVFSEDRCGF